MRWVVAGALAAALHGAAQAVAVVNPLPPIQPGLTAGIERFTTLPPTSAARPRAAAQQLRGPADGSGRLFVNDTRGVLYVTSTAGAAPTPYLDLRAQNIGFSNAASTTQTGFMGFAFHPNFGLDAMKPGYNLLYTVDTTAASAGTPEWAPASGPVSHHNVVREWTVADPKAGTARVDGMRELLRVAQPRADHGAGTIGFDPSAPVGSANYGKLFIGFGDGGGVNDPGNNAQNLASPFGKILRIDPADPDGAGPLKRGVPADNPFVGTAGALGEVWALGLRNPQQFSWDENGTMYIADIGQARIEEVNLGQAKANYGWPLREGSFGRGSSKADENIYDAPDPGPYTDPVAQYDHQEIRGDGISSGASVSGAYLYEGSLVPALAGNILLSDLVAGRLFYFDPADPSGFLRELLLTLDGLPTSFRALEGYGGAQRVDLRMGMDPGGEIYFLTKRDGAVYRFAAAAAAPVPEPATWLAMAAGFGIIGLALRRRTPALSA